MSELQKYIVEQSDPAIIIKDTIRDSVNNHIFNIVTLPEIINQLMSINNNTNKFLKYKLQENIPTYNLTFLKYYQ